MRVNFSALALAGAAFLAGCGDSPGPSPRPVSLLVPAAGRYQATLMGYSSRSCDDTLTEPVGALESAAAIGFLTEGRLELSGARIWPFGTVPLRPGDAADEVARHAWTGSREIRTVRGACILSSVALLRYFPIDVEHGNLTAQVSYAAAEGTCAASPLPCQNVAVWNLTYFP